MFMIYDKKNLIQNACNRVEHFSKSLEWYQQQLEQPGIFQENFLHFVAKVSECFTNAPKYNQVFFTAVGKSARVAELLCSMLVSVGILARFVHPTEAFHGDFGVIGEGDTVVFISNSGKSIELLELFPGLQSRSVHTFAMTAHYDSLLAKRCQFVLQIPPFGEMCPLTQAPITSTITTLALGQLVVAATIEARQFSLEDYARNHPGGAIGKRMLLKVEDVMLSGDRLPKISEQAFFLDVVSTFTRFSKGALLVVGDQGVFLGLISEKDLRTSMEKYKKDVFDLRAQDLMNPCPTSVRPDVLAIEIKNKMVEHSPPFNIIPVVDEQGLAVGLVRLLDLIAEGL